MQIGDYTDKNDLYTKIVIIHSKTLNYTVYGNGTIEEPRHDLTSAMVTMQDMFGADHRFDGMSQKRFVTLVVTSGSVFSYDNLEKESKTLYLDGVDFISIGKGIYRQPINHHNISCIQPYIHMSKNSSHHPQNVSLQGKYMFYRFHIPPD